MNPSDLSSRKGKLTSRCLRRSQVLLEDQSIYLCFQVSHSMSCSLNPLSVSTFPEQSSCTIYNSKFISFLKFLSHFHSIRLLIFRKRISFSITVCPHVSWGFHTEICAMVYYILSCANYALCPHAYLYHFILYPPYAFLFQRGSSFSFPLYRVNIAGFQITAHLSFSSVVNYCTIPAIIPGCIIVWDFQDCSTKLRTCT